MGASRSGVLAAPTPKRHGWLCSLGSGLLSVEVQITRSSNWSLDRDGPAANQQSERGIKTADSHDSDILTYAGR